MKEIVYYNENYVINKKCRGWTSDDNPSNNTSYYLCSGFWYRTLSSHSGYESFASVIRIGGGGGVNGAEVNSSDGGVQILELCY